MLHLLFIWWVIFGAILAYSPPRLRWFHITGELAGVDEAAVYFAEGVGRKRGALVELGRDSRGKNCGRDGECDALPRETPINVHDSGQ
jgi:hypothetical protein